MLKVGIIGSCVTGMLLKLQITSMTLKVLTFQEPPD